MSFGTPGRMQHTKQIKTVWASRINEPLHFRQPDQPPSNATPGLHETTRFPYSIRLASNASGSRHPAYMTNVTVFALTGLTCDSGERLRWIVLFSNYQIFHWRLSSPDSRQGLNSRTLWWSRPLVGWLTSAASPKRECGWNR